MAATYSAAWSRLDGVGTVGRLTLGFFDFVIAVSPDLVDDHAFHSIWKTWLLFYPTSVVR